MFFAVRVGEKLECIAATSNRSAIKNRLDKYWTESDGGAEIAKIFENANTENNIHYERMENASILRTQV